MLPAYGFRFVKIGLEFMKRNKKSGLPVNLPTLDVRVGDFLLVRS